MGLPDRFSAAARLLFRAESTITTSRQLEEMLLREIDGVMESGEGVSPERSLRVAAVFAGVRILCDSISHLPLGIFRREGRCKEPDRDTPPFALLHNRPNEWQTSFEWREPKVAVRVAKLMSPGL